MKSNKEKIYDFISVHCSGNDNHGVTTTYIAEALSLQRTNVSSLLNSLVEEGRIHKSNGRPVLYSSYSVNDEEAEETFKYLIGWNGSLQHAIQLAKAAVLYPGGSLNILIVGEKGTGKKEFAKIIYEYCSERKIFSDAGCFLQINCRDYQGNAESARDMLMGNRSDGLLNEAEKGVLYMDNVQYLDGGLLREISLSVAENGRRGFLIASCTPDTQPAQEEFQNEFPMVIRLPGLSDRPIEERMEMIQKIFSKEASRVGRELLVKSELMRRLLLYECPENLRQLKRDIKIGCANAYVREFSNKGEITLYVNDFEPSIRHGIPHFDGAREKVWKLVPENSVFSFDGRNIRISGEKNGNFYKELYDKAQKFEAEGLKTDDIQLLLCTEVERAFGKYKTDLKHEIRDRKELGLVVDEKLIDMVENFLTKVEDETNRKLSDSVFFGLCLHMKNVINGTTATEASNREDISKVVTKYKQEYLLSLNFAEKIQEEYHKQLSVDEVILITMFLCYEPQEKSDGLQPVILYALYGKNVAFSIVQTIIEITGNENVFSLEVSHQQKREQVYDSLKSCILEIERGKGVFIVYDSDVISEIAEEIACETGVMVRLLPAPITTMGVELARKATATSNLDAVYRDALCKIGNFAKGQQEYIVTICTTGKGGAEELKNYIEKYGRIGDAKVIPLAMSDIRVLKEKFHDLMKHGTILCVVGTFNPGLYSIPFCSVAEIFSTPKERLGELLKKAQSKDCEIDFKEIFSYLSNQFTHAEVDKLRPLVEEFLKQTDLKLKHLTQDTYTGLLIHTSCCVERLLAGEQSPKNPKKKAIMEQYPEEFKTVLHLLKPIEKAFHIIFNDDEVANILTIIFQI